MKDDISMYKDIIDLDRPVSKHSKMSSNDRASQFAPFSALTGLKEELKEVERVTLAKLELSDDEKEIINDKLIDIKNSIKDNIKVSLVYYKEDDKKIGGDYIKVKGTVKKIDTYKNIIVIDDKTIPLSDIMEIEKEE